MSPALLSLRLPALTLPVRTACRAANNPTGQAWERAANNWQEVPKGGIMKGNIKKIWYNPAVRTC